MDCSALHTLPASLAFSLKLHYLAGMAAAEVKYLVEVLGVKSYVPGVDSEPVESVELKDWKLAEGFSQELSSGGFLLSAPLDSEEQELMAKIISAIQLDPADAMVLLPKTESPNWDEVSNLGLDWAVWMSEGEQCPLEQIPSTHHPKQLKLSPKLKKETWGLLKSLF